MIVINGQKLATSHWLSCAKIIKKNHAQWIIAAEATSSKHGCQLRLFHPRSVIEINWKRAEMTEKCL